MNCTGREVIDVLERVVNLEWFRYTRIEGVNPDSISIPITVWRFGSNDVGTEKVSNVVRTLQSVVNNFSGNVQWSLRYCGRNWVLQPAVVQRMEDAGTFETYGELLDILRSQDPKLAPMALKDLCAIAGQLAVQLRA